MLDSYNKKLNNLPLEAQNLLLSDKGFELEYLIIKKYDFLIGQRQKLGEIIASLFFGDLLLKDLIGEIMRVFNVDENQAKNLALDIVGMRILVAEKILKIKAKEFIKENEGNPDDFTKYVKMYYEDDKEIETDKKEKVELQEVAYNPEKEKEDSKEIFFGMLSGFLADHVNPFLGDYNGSLIQLFSEDKVFKGELEKLLFTNGEFLTHQHFELDGKSHSPTIGNWIQDFIAYNGSGMFSNLALTKYITDSENAKRLPPEEKRLVQKLLQLYRNLKFFPESLENIPVEEWEIIPVNRDKGAPEQFKKPIGPPKTAEEKEIDKLREEERGFEEGGLERLAIEEEIENKKRLEGLRIEANRYVPGSLERMAVEEEIRRLGT